MGMLDLIKPISQEPHNSLTVIDGKPGSGKTTLAGSFPKPMLYVAIDTDGGGEVLKDYSDDEIKVLHVTTDKPGAGSHAQAKLMELTKELKSTQHPYKTIVIDAYSSVEEGVVKYLEGVKGKKLSIDERGSVGKMMLDLRDELVDIARTGVEVIAVCHVKDKECTDNTTGEKSIMIIPKMSYNNGNLLLERASAVIYCARKTIVNDDNTRRVAFLAYLGAHPNMDTKLRTAGKKLKSGLYVEDLTYDKLQEIINGTQAVEDIQKLNVVEPKESVNNEENKNTDEEW
jgi:nucleoside-triphosphatase THEP1